MVRAEGIEPPRPRTPDFESGASTSSAMPAHGLEEWTPLGTHRWAMEIDEDDGSVKHSWQLECTPPAPHRGLNCPGNPDLIGLAACNGERQGDCGIREK